MSETTYTYSGPPSGVTLCQDGRDREIALFPGRPVTLPSGHPWVQGAVARGHLHATAPATKRKKARTAATTTTTEGA
jgi:hypothetical protein